MNGQLHPDSLLSELRKFLLNCFTHILPSTILSALPPLWYTNQNSCILVEHLNTWIIAICNKASCYLLVRFIKILTPGDMLNVMAIGKTICECIFIHIIWKSFE